MGEVCGGPLPPSRSYAYVAITSTNDADDFNYDYKMSLLNGGVILSFHY